MSGESSYTVSIKVTADKTAKHVLYAPAYA